MKQLLLAALALAPIPYEADFRAVAGLRWLDRAAQVKAESGFRPTVTAFDGGMGLGQFMPKTWAWCIEQGWVLAGDSPYDVRPNLTAQHRFMNYLEGRTATFTAALGAYNAGLGSVRKAQRLADSLGLEGQDSWLRALPNVTHANAAITQAYVARIKATRAQWAREGRG